MCMSVAEDSISKEKVRVNTPLECWGCINSPRCHEDRFRTYRNFPNNMDPEVTERANRSIQEYAQRNSAMGRNRESKGIQYGIGQTYSTTTRSMFAERRS